MEILERYNHLNSYLIKKFGERTLKICVDAGFTCPNRDGTLSNSGCIFCSENGSGEHLNSCSNSKNITENIQSQINNFLNSYRGARANKFIVYFQNFSNTYDTLENLKIKYDSAFLNDKIVGIQIATRPDCINEEIAKLLYSYSTNHYVCVELGLQTSNPQTSKLLNLQYDYKDFENAVKILNKYNIDIVAHIMIGLPNETKKDLENTISFLNQFSIQGLKIHNTYVVKNTKLADMYFKNKYTPITFDEYLESLVFVLTHISPDIIIHRISGDAPKDLLVAPEWNTHKKWILNGIEKTLKERNLHQGIYFL